MSKNPSQRSLTAAPSLAYFGRRAHSGLALITLFMTATAAWSQCAPGAVTVLTDRDTTIYEDATGMLGNGAGDYFFAGVTGANRIVRGLIHFDVAGALSPGDTIGEATLSMTLNQPVDHGMHTIGLHRLQADWGEGASLAGMGEGGGGTAMTGDATWVHTFFNTSTWSTMGGDFDPLSSAATLVDGSMSGLHSWNSMQMVMDAQDWLDTPATNFGWLVQGTEGAGTSALRFNSRNNIGSEPVLCLELCPGISPSCPGIFNDGFESGDTTAWDNTVA